MANRFFGLLLSLMLMQNVFPQHANSFRTHGLNIYNISSGAGTIGANRFQFYVANQADSARAFYFSLRTEGGSNWQKGYYFYIEAKSTRHISVEYHVPNRTNRLLKAYFGEAGSMPSKENPRPKAKRYRTLLFQTEGTRALWNQISGAFHFWGRCPKDSSAGCGATDSPGNEGRRNELRKLMQWNRKTADDFCPRTVDRFSIGNMTVQSMRIHGEPGVFITFLLMRASGSPVPGPTVLYLSGNPPGTKESGIAKMMPLVDAGFQVVAMDRRQSARHTGRGEFLRNIADPVFDAARLVDYLVTRSDVACQCVSIVGFSAGAEEAQYLMALHPGVHAGVLIARPIDHQYLFNSNAWWPTLYNPDILADIGLGSLADANFAAQINALTARHNQAALSAFRSRYPYFDKLNSTYILLLAVPKPLLLITGARDLQFPLAGVLALDEKLNSAYEQHKAGSNSALYIMPRHGHTITPRALDLTIDFLRTRTGGN